METKDIKDINDSKLAISIYNDLASPAMKQIGQSAEGLLKLVALPFKFLGFTAEQLEKKYAKFIEEAVNRVPPQKLTAPQSSVVAPLLDYAKFCFADEPGNDLLQEMFSKLLSSSINQDNASHLNKSFVETMRFLSGNEAKLLQSFSDVITHHANPRFRFTHFLSSFSFYEHKCGQEAIKTMVINTSTPFSSIRFDFPINESLNLLTSLGLIELLEEDSSAGNSFFGDLYRLQYNGKVDFEIPPLFDSAMSYAYIHTNYICARSTRYSGSTLLTLLKSEIPQLYNILSQKENITMEQLMEMHCYRAEIHITPYGNQFLKCCIQ